MIFLILYIKHAIWVSHFKIISIYQIIREQIKIETDIELKAVAKNRQDIIRPSS